MWGRVYKRQRIKVLKIIVFALYIIASSDKNKASIRRWWVRPWLLARQDRGLGLLSLLHNEFPVDDPEQYKTFLRMDEETFNKLLTLVRPYIEKQNTVMRDAISARDKLSLTLRFLATGESYRSLMYSFRIHESTISKFVPLVCVAIYNVLRKDYLKIPQTAADWLNIAKQFEELWNFPNTLGALDGKHIIFRPPRSAGSTFRNYKNSDSIVLLALVDVDYNFTYVNVGVNGRVSDGGVFLNSELYSQLFSDTNLLNLPEDKPLPGRCVNIPHVIIGDGAFPLSDRVLKPYPFKNINIEQRVFNYRLSRARRCVENAFGILANRFRVLLTTINLKEETVKNITKACCALHNFLKTEVPNYYIEGEEIDTSFLFKFAHSQQKVNRCKQSAKNIREEFKNYVNNEGAVPWQNNINIMF